MARTDGRTRRAEREAHQADILGWFGMMYGVLQAMPQREREELERWEAANLDGATVGTSDWPGWEKYIGPRPVFGPREPRRSKKLPIPPALRWQVWERDNFTCRSCHARTRLSVDHIHPESRGGTLELSNLQTLCTSCNSRKGSRAPSPANGGAA